MKILSQDRNIIINFDNIARIYAYTPAKQEGKRSLITCIDVNGHATDLATYSDESIAREVLFKIFDCTADTYMLPK